MNINNSIFLKEEKEVAINLSKKININTQKNEITHFLTNIEQQVLEKIINFNKKNVTLKFFGGTNDAERCRAKLIINDYYDIDYNIACIKANFNEKFHKIKHKDVLGAIHNIGVKYDRIGDIIIKNNEIFIFVDKSIAEYLTINFSKIGRAILNFEIVEKLEKGEVDVEKKYNSFTINCTSQRIDNIVSKIINKSRNKAKELIQKEYVKINHITTTAIERNCKINDLISIRKYGRYIIKNSEQNKKTLKYRITVDKLI